MAKKKKRSSGESDTNLSEGEGGEKREVNGERSCGSGKAIRESGKRWGGRGIQVKFFYPNCSTGNRVARERQ